MKPFFCRIGNKRPIADRILKIIPPHKTYVEPFVGSGAILFAKEPSEHEILNDLDKTIFEDLSILKKSDPNPDNYVTYSGIPMIQRFVNKTPKTTNELLMQNLYTSCNTFSTIGKGKIYKPHSQEAKIENIDKYVDRLKHVKIYNKDYKVILEKYDNPDTFFFIDPPYESSDVYNHNKFDYQELADVMRKIKGKFLITLNDSRNIRKLFDEYYISGITVPSGAGHGKGKIGKDNRKELFITNYKIS